MSYAQASASKGLIVVGPIDRAIRVTIREATQILEDLPSAIELATIQARVSKAQMRLSDPAASVGSDTL